MNIELNLQNVSASADIDIDVSDIAREIGEDIDLSDVAQWIDIDDVARALSMDLDDDDVAQRAAGYLVDGWNQRDIDWGEHIDYGQLADNVSGSRLARDVAEQIDVDDVAEYVANNSTMSNQLASAISGLSDACDRLDDLDYWRERSDLEQADQRERLETIRNDLIEFIEQRAAQTLDSADARRHVDEPIGFIGRLLWLIFG